MASWLACGAVLVTLGTFGAKDAHVVPGMAVTMASHGHSPLLEAHLLGMGGKVALTPATLGQAQSLGPQKPALGPKKAMDSAV